MKWFWTVILLLAGIGWAVDAITIEASFGVHVGLAMAASVCLRLLVEEHEKKPS